VKFRLLSILVIILATPVDALAECPNGTQQNDTTEYSSTNYLAWSDDSKWYLCKPSGPGETKCGDITTDGLSSNMNLKDRNGNWVSFDETKPLKVEKGQVSCVDRGGNLVCIRKSDIYTEYRNRWGETSKVLHMYTIFKETRNCLKISF